MDDSASPASDVLGAHVIETVTWHLASWCETGSAALTCQQVGDQAGGCVLLQTGGLLGLLPIALAGPLRRLAAPRAALPMLLVAGLLAETADVALAIAFTRGDIAVVSVLASLDSAVSVVLARMILRERLSLRQAAAVLAVLTGAVLLAAG